MYSSFFSLAGTFFSRFPPFSQAISVFPSRISNHTLTSPTFFGSNSGRMLSKSSLSMRSFRRITSLDPADKAKFCIATSAAAASLALRCAPNFLLSFINCCIKRYFCIISSSLHGISEYAISISLLRLTEAAVFASSGSSFPSTASAYLRARECFAPSEMYFAAS